MSSDLSFSPSAQGSRVANSLLNKSSQARPSQSAIGISTDSFTQVFAQNQADIARQQQTAVPLTQNPAAPLPVQDQANTQYSSASDQSADLQTQPDPHQPDRKQNSASDPSSKTDAEIIVTKKDDDQSSSPEKRTNLEKAEGALASAPELPGTETQPNTVKLKLIKKSAVETAGSTPDISSNAADTAPQIVLTAFSDVKILGIETKKPDKTETFITIHNGKNIGSTLPALPGLAIEASSTNQTLSLKSTPQSATDSDKAIMNAFKAALDTQPATSKTNIFNENVQSALIQAGDTFKTSVNNITPNILTQPFTALTTINRTNVELPVSVSGGADAISTLASFSVTIGSKALKGAREFTIHLDPAELGRVEVKMVINDNGEIKTKMTVDRPETMHLLQRDSGSLQRSLEQAGFKSNSEGLQFSLRQDHASHRHTPADWSDGKNNAHKNIILKDEASTADVTGAVMNAYARRNNSALDIHI